MKMIKKLALLPVLALLALILLPAMAAPARADALDEIINYEITADVNEDGTVSMIYHIDWKVLDSDSEGPLEWVKIGIPNSHCEDIEGRSDAVKKIKYTSDGGSYIRVDLDRKYYEGEVAEIEFELTQDYLYEVNWLTEGETVYSFTPGWFDDIEIDNLTIRWNADRAISQMPACAVRKGYFEWSASVSPGGMYTVEITYPNDAFGFDESKTIDRGWGDDDYTYESESPIVSIIGGIFGMAIVGLPIFLFVKAVKAFGKGSGFTGGTQKKIVRTKVEYYPSCQGCGATRPDGANNCPYCGRSFIKSEETIEEKDI
ncbi:MAG: hypothetical protein II784_00445, partial [Oscillospiraceae bacterium]|nr:hypothetical protein [Oscillospiraceae bacterium]